MDKNRRAGRYPVRTYIYKYAFLHLHSFGSIFYIHTVLHKPTFTFTLFRQNILHAQTCTSVSGVFRSLTTVFDLARFFPAELYNFFKQK